MGNLERSKLGNLCLAVSTRGALSARVKQHAISFRGQQRGVRAPRPAPTSRGADPCRGGSARMLGYQKDVAGGHLAAQTCTGLWFRKGTLTESKACPQSQDSSLGGRRGQRRYLPLSPICRGETTERRTQVGTRGTGPGETGTTSRTSAPWPAPEPALYRELPRGTGTHVFGPNFQEKPSFVLISSFRLLCVQLGTRFCTKEFQHLSYYRIPGY